MENSNQVQNMEPGMICAIPSGDTICIPRMRYEELIRAETEREILFHAFQMTSRYDIENIMRAIFIKYGENDDAE